MDEEEDGGGEVEDDGGAAFPLIFLSRSRSILLRPLERFASCPFLARFLAIAINTKFALALPASSILCQSQMFR